MNLPPLLRPGRADDAAALTAVTLAAKAHWGYPARWLELWRTDGTRTGTSLVRELPSLNSESSSGTSAARLRGGALPDGRLLFAARNPGLGDELWVSERDCYTYGTFMRGDDCSGSCSGCGHYTQVVWERSRRLGCGVATCGGSSVWVCNYDPPGNVLGQAPY